MNISKSIKIIIIKRERVGSFIIFIIHIFEKWGIMKNDRLPHLSNESIEALSIIFVSFPYFFLRNIYLIIINIGDYPIFKTVLKKKKWLNFIKRRGIGAKKRKKKKKKN